MGGVQPFTYVVTLCHDQEPDVPRTDMYDWAETGCLTLTCTCRSGVSPGFTNICTNLRNLSKPLVRSDRTRTTDSGHFSMTETHDGDLVMLL